MPSHDLPFINLKYLNYLPLHLWDAVDVTRTPSWPKSSFACHVPDPVDYMFVGIHRPCYPTRYQLTQLFHTEVVTCPSYPLHLSRSRT